MLLPSGGKRGEKGPPLMGLLVDSLFVYLFVCLFICFFTQLEVLAHLPQR